MRLMWFVAGGLLGTGAAALALLWLPQPDPPPHPLGPTRADLVRIDRRAAEAERRANRAAAEVCDLLVELARRDADCRELRARLDAARRGGVGLAGAVGDGDRIPATNLPER